RGTPARTFRSCSGTTGTEFVQKAQPRESSFAIISPQVHRLRAHNVTFNPMIALLRGTLLEKHPNQAIVETGGVGYDVAIPVSTFTNLPDPGAEVRLRIHTHVREDALSLYGFLTQDEKALFEKLIGV